jgi:hypothetical protein
VNAPITFSLAIGSIPNRRGQFWRVFWTDDTLPSVPARIAGFLRNTAPNSYCDTCLSTALGIPLVSVARETKLLARYRRREFERSRGVCSYCGGVHDLITATSS